MSFDLKLYFSVLPEKFATEWQAALLEMGMKETVLVPAKWETEGVWYLLEKPSDTPDDDGSFAVYVSPIDPTELQEQECSPDEIALLATKQYCVYISTRMSAGNFALMVAGTLAKVTNAVMFDPQCWDFEKALAMDFADHRATTQERLESALMDRGYYDSHLAWSIAKAARASDEREAAAQLEPREPETHAAEEKPSTLLEQAKSPATIVAGLLIVAWVCYKLSKAGYF